MKDRIARKALEVVENHHKVMLQIITEISQQRDHAGAVQEVSAARPVIGEYRFNGIALLGCMGAAAMFMSVQGS